MLLFAGSGVGLGSDAGVTKNRATFQDARGEEPDGPDISSVVVANDDAGTITFRIGVPSNAEFTVDMAIQLSLDTDFDAATGAPGPGESRGWDHRILWNPLVARSVEPRLLRCGSDRCISVPGTTVGLRSSYAGGATFTISDAELGNTKRFRFIVSVTTGIVRTSDYGVPADWSRAKWDFAPGLDRTWSYTLRLAQPLLARFSAGQAIAGRTFAVRLAASKGGTAVSQGRVTCTAAIGGKPLRPRSQGFVRGRATCVFAIPSNASGKTIRGTIALRYQGTTVTRSFVRRIRS